MTRTFAKKLVIPLFAACWFFSPFAGAQTSVLNPDGSVTVTVPFGLDLPQYPGVLESLVAEYAPTSRLDVQLQWPALIPGEPYAVEWNRQWDVSVDAVFSRGVVELAQHDVIQFGAASGPAWPNVTGIDFTYPVPSGAPLVISGSRTLDWFQGRSTVDLSWSVFTTGSQPTIVGEPGPAAGWYDALSYELVVTYFPADLL